MTFDPLGQEHAAKRAGVAGARRKAHVEEGALAATHRAALELWDRQKRDGLSLADRLRGLEKTLRLVWPKGREADWKSLCTNCRDYGLVMHDCPGDATCSRTKPHLPHEYGEPCWCQLGARFKVQTKRAQDFTEAGQSRPTKVGRR